MKSVDCESLWHCYVINLERSLDRRLRIEQQFASLSIPFTRISAIDICQEPEPELPLNFTLDAWGFALRRGKRALPGEIGCYASHLKAIQAFLASNAEFALICEDDIVPQDDLRNVLEAILAQPGWEIVRLAQCREKSFIPWVELSSNRFLGTSITGFSYAAGYLLSRSGAERVLQKISVMRLPYDLALFHGWQGIREASVFPSPILLDDTQKISTIQTSRQHHFPILKISRLFYECYSRIWRYSLQMFRVWQRKNAKRKMCELIRTR